jgi:hypothetical protein
MRQLCARLDVMETTQRIEPNVGDINESENENVEAANLQENKQQRRDC